MDIYIIIGLTLVIGFYMAWNIGANDVSNAIGTSVGSKALSLKHAIILAAILEFIGAFFLGSHVSNTIQVGIIDPSLFAHNPKIFALGMMGSLLGTGVWLNVASFFRLPVSTTHAIVGAVFGFGLIVAGFGGVDWTNLGYISLSWITSPLLSGLVAFFLFMFLQKKILFAHAPLIATKKIFPILVFIVFAFFSLSLFYQGLASLQLKLSLSLNLLIALCCGLFSSLLSYYFIRKIPLSKTKHTFKHHPQQLASLEKAAKHLQRTKLSSEGDMRDSTSNLLSEIRNLTAKIKENTQYHESSSEYAKVEKIFAYLQIFSAAMVAFAHGANDVANAIGPVSAVIQTLKTNIVSKTAITPHWILALGGIGIIIGLTTWGWRIIETIGKKITFLTPTRGFCAEFSSSIIILLASKFGMPISTSHALVGAVLGVGLARGLSSLNLKMLRTIILTWIITIPACAVISIIFFYILRLIF